MHKTAAWPLAILYAGLIVYASLYPFADWRNQDIEQIIANLRSSDMTVLLFGEL